MGWVGPFFFERRESLDTKTLIAEVGRLISPTVESLGCELIEVEYLNELGRWILRLYVDTVKGGITVGDCEKVSRAASALLDVENIIPGRYNLEVSSPGIERPVRRPEDFKKYAGSVIKIRTHKKIGDRRNFKGTIKDFENGAVHLFENGEVIKIPLEEILKARLQTVKGVKA